MDKRKCLKCKKVKTFSKALKDSLVCRDCLPNEENVEKANEIIRKHFSDLGKKSWESRKKKLLETMSKVKVHECDTCGSFISDEEYKKGEGACSKCWDK